MQRWTTDVVSPLELVLDNKNDRINITSDAKQDAIRLALYETEEVADLVKDIIEVNGLLPTERIIVCKEARKYVVLEGNRRICACQSILDKKLIPAKYRDFMLAYGLSDSLLESLKVIEVIVAPNREAADIAITRKHTDPAIKAWSPQAKYRRIRRLLMQGKTLEQIVQQFRQNRAGVQRSMREFGMLDYVSNLDVWTADERILLASPRLKTNAFTRFFTLGGVCVALSVDYNEQGRVIEPTPRRQAALFQRALELIARVLLLPNPTGEDGKPELNTRATAEQVFEKIEGMDPRLIGYISRERQTKSRRKDTSAGSNGSGEDASAKPQDQAGGAGTHGAEGAQSPSKPEKPGPLPKLARFFEDLECHIDDEVLRTYAREIRMIDYRRLQTSAAFLMRGLVEHALKWSIKDKQLDKKLKEYLYKHSGNRKIKGSCPECNKDITLPAGGKSKDPGLQDLISFSIQHADELFGSNAIPAKRNLNIWSTHSKDYIDIVIHGHYVLASEAKLIDAAKTLRPFVKSILHQSKKPAAQNLDAPQNI